MHHNVRHWDLEQGRCHSAAVPTRSIEPRFASQEGAAARASWNHAPSLFTQMYHVLVRPPETSKCKESQGIQALSVTCSRPHHHVLASNMPKPEVKSFFLKSKRQACPCSNYGSVALVTYSITVRMLGRPTSQPSMTYRHTGRHWPAGLHCLSGHKAIINGAQRPASFRFPSCVI